MHVKENARLSRRGVARLLSITPDSVSRLVPEGLGYAVTARRGRGGALTFDVALVTRWWRLRACQRAGGGPCQSCRLALEDALAVTEHLAAAGHCHGACPECRAPGGLIEPCA